MKRLALVVIALAVIAAQGAFAQDAARLLKAAINTEMVDSDPKAAIEQYKKVVASGNRPLAAEALLRMAGCYQKLGDAEAQKTLAQIVREYADQAEVVAKAKSRMGTGAGAGARTQPASDESRSIWTVPKDVRILGPVSADGRFLPIRVRDGNLAVRDLRDGTERIIPRTPAEERASSIGTLRLGESVVSRDGRRIASRMADSTYPGVQVPMYTQLRVSVVGESSASSQKTTLIDGADVVPYDWTADGLAIAVRRKVTPTTQQIEIVSVPSGAVRVLKTLEWRANGPFSGRLSPDGRRLAVEIPGNVSGARDILVLPVDGGPEVRAVEWTGDDILLGWSPDGSSVLFSSARGSGTLDIWRQRLDAQALALGPELVRRNGPARPLGITLSGAMFSHDELETGGAGSCERTPTCGVKESIFDFEAGRFISPPKDVSDAFVRSNEAPRWSPDGTRLAYYAGRGGREGVIVIKDIATGESREVSLKFLIGGHHSWDWAPDGLAVVAHGQDVDRKSGEFALHRINIETGEVSLILPFLRGLFFTFLSWSADGRTLYYHRDLPSKPGRSRWVVRVARDVVTGAEREFATNETYPWFEGKAYDFREDSQGGTIIENDTATGAERALLRVYGGSYREFNFRLTKDGRTIVANTTDPTTNEGTVVLCSVDDASVKTVFRDARGRRPEVELLSRDDRSAIVRSTDREGTPVYWWVPFDGRAPKPLDEMAGMNLLGTGPRRQKIELHPDGRRLAFGVIYPEVSLRRILVLEKVLSITKR